MDEKKFYQDARALLLEKNVGILSTHSSDLPGYPFGSVTPYCLDAGGFPIILISEIAQHTKNIKLAPKVSLTVCDLQNEGDPQGNPRLTYLGEAKKVPAEESPAYERYYRYFPQSRGYHETHDFNLYRIDCKRGRYIGGFGKIFWVESPDLVLKNPFSPNQEIGILNHMNKDHADALVKYCEKYKKLSVSDPKMVGIDATGFDLLLPSEKKLRFSFPYAIATSEDARKVLVDLLRA